MIEQYEFIIVTENHCALELPLHGRIETTDI